MKGLSAALAMASLCATQISAQSGPRCAPREVVVEHLATEYGESRQSIGLGANNAVMEIFASESSRTWTIIVTTASGLTCLMASGLAFETLAEALPTKGRDT
ncbi:hypothetical protein [Roseovarius carneus]|uniref:hypothetical protein n=1 Tax=Roseovarius carneus TaxID=2853164 RepID=UPI0037CBF089